MPIVYIWSPKIGNPYGHAALQTDKYHISFWPDGDVKKELGTLTTALVGVNASLVFHHELDLFYEDKCRPTGVYEIVNVTDEAINGIHEKFLHYNGIKPADVTLKVAEEHIDIKKPEISVGKTPYTFVADIVGQTSVLNVISSTSSTSGSLHSEPFYYRKQSCVSFCFNLIQMADPKPQGIPSQLTDIVTSQALDNFTVPWFQSYIQRYWVKDKHAADNAFGRIKKYWLG
ncbi:uncharacterized protein LOC124349971 [Daphnia pulicaria]|jgi:hypothetical protein|uniref:uncharacterized protein LOC124349971 n=1 Tax=Daphnia pulicaria TaxID=35523 RepID=UPI001EECA893|nr:uncharacterized protein LOC124349971 [Daphnia pulicaria]